MCRISKCLITNFIIDNCSFKEKNWELLKKQYSRNKVALTFLSNFESDDVAAVELGANSTSLWIISPPDLDRLLEELKSSKRIFIKLSVGVLISFVFVFR